MNYSYRLIYWVKNICIFGLLLGCDASLAARLDASETVSDLGVSYKIKISQSKKVLSSYMARNGVPGITVAVMENNELVWSEGLGFSDVENSSPMLPKTKTRIGSISKSFTAVGMGLLLDQGKFDLELPIQHYVPSFPKKKYSVTPRHLATHLSGIRHYPGVNYTKSPEYLSTHHYENILEGLNVFKDDPLLSEPGEKFKYSSYGYNLLGAAMQAAAQQDFVSYMEDNVFQTLGMRDTMAQSPTAIIYDRSRLYSREGGKLVHAPFVDNSYKLAGGGFLSTAKDVALFGNAMINSDFLSAKTLELLWTPQLVSTERLDQHGMGWWTINVPGMEGQQVVGHKGGSVGGNAMFYVVPDRNLVVSVASNLTHAKVQDAAVRVLQIFSDVQ